MKSNGDRFELPPELAEQINQRSNELIEEFHEHAADFAKKLKAERPELVAKESVDLGKVYEGWAIQKIAGLQLLVLSVIERVEELEAGH